MRGGANLNCDNGDFLGEVFSVPVEINILLSFVFLEGPESCRNKPISGFLATNSSDI